MTEPPKGQRFSISKADVKNFIVITAWVVELIVIVGVAVGLINPPPNTLQATLVNAIVGSFITISATALGAYLGKAQTS